MVNNSAKDKPIIFPKGAKCVFMGHSFFHPIADMFDHLATKSGKYPKHSMQLVKSPGDSGLPDALWENKKREVESMLSSKDVDLFGMTVGPAKDGKSINVYKRWIDLALSYNPKTSIFIGHPWAKKPASTDLKIYMNNMRKNGDETFNSLINTLRRSYPDTNIFFLNYGICVGEIKALFEEGKLDKISKMTGSDLDNCIFRDTVGHSGTLVQQMAAITWMSWFYNGVPLKRIGKIEKSKQKLKNLGWNVKNIDDILTVAGEVNEPYRLY